MSLSAAQAGDQLAFSALVDPYRRELEVHCYRMLGSLQDAEDALQETLLAAWRGLGGFQERSSLRTWLYQIATNCCLRTAHKRPKRLLSWDHSPARSPGEDLGAPLTNEVFLEPLPTGIATDPSIAYEQREHLGLAWVAALQHLPPNQRAVLVLRDVLDFSAADTAEALDTSPQSVNSALQRARKTIETIGPADDAPLTDDAQATAASFLEAFERADVPAIIELLSADVRFTMPPLPAWFDGRDDVLGFLANSVFATPWKASASTFNGQPGLVCYQEREGAFRLSAVIVLHFNGDRIAWIASFIDPAYLARLGLPEAI